MLFRRLPIYRARVEPHFFAESLWLPERERTAITPSTASVMALRERMLALALPRMTLMSLLETWFRQRTSEDTVDV